MMRMPPNSAVEQPAGSHSLAAAAHRERWAARMAGMDNFQMGAFR
jgi:hypothetical protein